MAWCDRSTLTAMSLRSRIEYLCRTHGIDALYVFGSRTQEVCRHLDDERLPAVGAGSDVDIGILPAVSTVLTVDRKVAIAAAIEDLFDVRRVDLVVIPDADPFVAVNVIRGECLYRRDQAGLDEYELYVLRRAGDLAPLERERLEEIGGA